MKPFFFARGKPRTLSTTVHEVCAVFDLDDTLYLERDYVYSGFKHVGLYAARELGIPDFAERAWSLFLAGQRGNIFDKILREQSLRWDRSKVEVLISLYRSHPPNICLLPDAVQCLDTLHGKVRLAIISDGPLASQRNKIVALRLKKWFDPIVLTQGIGKGFPKPYTSAFHLIQERFGLDSGRFYYVADNPAKDFIAPRKLGWRTVRVRRKEGLHSEMEAEGEWAAGAEVPDLSGLPILLEGSRL
jgi:putative hydrolase of the HAD superfamily